MCWEEIVARLSQPSPELLALPLSDLRHVREILSRTGDPQA